jgi:hypothetical protein
LSIDIKEQIINSQEIADQILAKVVKGILGSKYFIM